MHGSWCEKNHVYLGSWYLRVLNAILVITILVSRSCSKCWNQQIIPFTLSHHISIGHADRNTIWNPHIHIFTQLNTRAATKWQTISPASRASPSSYLTSTHTLHTVCLWVRHYKQPTLKLRITVEDRINTITTVMYVSYTQHTMKIE